MKRTIDVIGASFLLLALSPIIALTALAVRIQLGAPMVFRQQRPGLHGEPFIAMKFRTMLNSRGADGALLADEHRLTSFGAFLRSTSLDELPQLWNVLKGEMSFVGPRPLLMQYLPLYSREQARRHDVRPGITGWAQVNGRNAISWEEKFSLDVWYVDHQSLALDARIVWLTILRLLARSGINNAGSATMPAFTGSPPERADGPR